MISGYEKDQESHRQLPQPEEKKLSLFCFYHLFPHLHSLSRVTLHLRETSGSIYPKPSRLEDPCALSGCRAWACFSVGPCCCGRARACPLACLDHLKALIHPFPCTTSPLLPLSSQMPSSMVNVALHLKWKILNRFIQKLQQRQPTLRLRRVSNRKESKNAEEAKLVPPPQKMCGCIYVCIYQCTCHRLHNETSICRLHPKCAHRKCTSMSQDHRWNDWDIHSVWLFGLIHSPLRAKCQSRLSVCTDEWKQSESGWLLKVTEKLFKHPVIMV